MDIFSCEQRSDEWFQARLGKWTASNFDKLITPSGKESASAASFNNKLAAEIIIGRPEETYTSEAMQRGIELEPEAFTMVNDFDNPFGWSFKEVGFIDSGLGYGCSPDGIDPDLKIGLELKCPSAHTHVEYLASDEMPKKYWAQVQGSMLVTGYDQWVFCSYHPDFPPQVIVVKKDDKFCQALKEVLEKNCKMVSETVEKIKLRNKCGLCDEEGFIEKDCEVSFVAVRFKCGCLD
jgi:hypothetical protein